MTAAFGPAATDPLFDQVEEAYLLTYALRAALDGLIDGRQRRAQLIEICADDRAATDAETVRLTLKLSERGNALEAALLTGNRDLRALVAALAHLPASPPYGPANAADPESALTTSPAPAEAQP